MWITPVLPNCAAGWRTSIPPLLPESLASNLNLSLLKTLCWRPSKSIKIHLNRGFSFQELGPPPKRQTENMCLGSSFRLGEILEDVTFCNTSVTRCRYNSLKFEFRKFYEILDWSWVWFPLSFCNLMKVQADRETNAEAHPCFH